MSHSSPEPLATGATRRIPIVVAQGDGIGPEIMSATLRILEAAEVDTRSVTRPPARVPASGSRSLQLLSARCT